MREKAENVKEGFEMVGKPCAVEYKYDGFRLLIHKKGKEVIKKVKLNQPTLVGMGKNQGIAN